MCGIAGVLYRDGTHASAHVLQAMASQLRHRGPDGSGVRSFQGAGLAHTRLAIIDLTDAAAQPLGSDDGKVWVTFNGEIYNFRELRAELEGKGHRFRSSGDTEVIVRLYEEVPEDDMLRLQWLGFYHDKPKVGNLMMRIKVPGGQITEDGVRLNVSVALQYLNSWLNGNGAAAIFNLMEDAATAEISRSQLWQWLHHGAKLADGRPVTPEMYTQIREEELAKLGGSGAGRYKEATDLLDGLVLSQEFVEFLTYPAYELLD